jgi:negative regulator of flagellin synthesis FlgM
MKIDGMDPRAAGTTAGAKSAPIDAKTLSVGQDTVAKGGESGLRPAAVDITADGQALNDAADRIRQTPEVNQARVDAVRAALERGEYTVDATRVADRILDLEESL